MKEVRLRNYQKPEKHDHFWAYVAVWLLASIMGIGWGSAMTAYVGGYDGNWHNKVDCHIATHEVQVEVPDYCITPEPTVEVGE